MSCSGRFFKRLAGNREIEDSLGKLDKLTQEEAQLASAEQLRMTHSVDGRVRGVEGQVQDVRDDVQDVGSKVEGVGSNISNKVQGVDDKLDQVNSSLSPYTPIVIPRLRQLKQGTSSEKVFYDGFHRQIHPRTITLHANPITSTQLNGYSKEVYIIDGNRLARSCGYTENVRYSWSLPCTDP